MALKIPKVGLTEMLKEGYKNYQGLEEAVFRNIAACKQLSQVTRTSLGPNGKNKMIINHLDKLFVTNDAATIIREMDVIHPAAKMLVMASEQQEKEVGDSSNFVIVFAGELLQKADGLLRIGLHPSDIIEGYTKASKKAIELLEGLVVSEVKDIFNKENLKQALLAPIASKQFGYEELLASLVSEACLNVMPKNPKNFNVDNVRVVKILGASTLDSRVMRGMVFNREPDSTVQHATNAKVAVFSCSIDVTKTETKGTVLITNSEDLLNFSKGEEAQLEQCIKELADSGAKVIVTGSGIGELAFHFINRYGMMAIKVLSKFELRRLCKVVGATPLARLGAPIPEEMGYCDIVEVTEIGGDRVTIFRQEKEESQMSTIVVRGATTNLMDDIERAIDDAVNVVKAIVRDPRLVPGAGATEIELARALSAIGKQETGLAQYSINKFAEAFEVIPSTLAENAGMDTTEVIAKLYAAHQNGKKSFGVDVESEDNGVIDVTSKGILDSYLAKYWAIKFATDAAVTVLRVDQIIMSKPAGGPKPRENKNWDEDPDPAQQAQ